METDHNLIIERLDAQEKELQAIYASVEKTRKYFLMSLWITVILFVLPLIGMVFAIPMFISTYSSMQGLL
jgi:hypothetical protein